MSKFQIHNTDDFVILESENQAISIICFSIAKIEDGVLSHQSRRIFNFFDSFGYSYVIQMSKSSLKLLLVISAENVGEVINKVSALLDKMQIIEPINPYLVVSTTNHMGLAEELMEAYFSPIKKTSESRIIKMSNKYWIFSSLVFPRGGNSEILQYFQDVLTFENCYLNLSSKATNKHNKNKQEIPRSILISFNSSSFEKSIEFLSQLQKLSLLYKDRISFTVRFHSLNEIKRNKILFLLGLPNKQQFSTNWDAYFKIERFIPNIQTVSRRQKRKKALPSHKNIDIAISPPKKRTLHLSQIAKAIKFPTWKKLYQYNSNLFFSLFRRKQARESSHKIKIENINIESKSAKTLVPYGKEISTEEINKLVENIPTPPS